MASLAAQQTAAAIYYSVMGKDATSDAYDYFGQQLEGGSKTLDELTESLLASPEASARFASKSLEQIITQVYTSVHGAAPTASQLSELITGTTTTSSVIAKIVDGLLHYAGTDATTLAQQSAFETTINGSLYPATKSAATEGSADVQALYHSLGRTQVQEGINYWGEVLANGSKSFNEVANAFVNATAALKGLSNSDFVNFIFQNTYNRAATSSELDQYVNSLSNASSRGDVLVDVITSIRGNVAAGDTSAQTSFNAATKVYQQGTLPALNFQEQAASVYLAVPGRGIDAEALNHWSKELAAGKSFSSLNASLLKSGEFQKKGAQLTGDEFIQHVFSAVHGVAATAAQLATYASLSSKEAITSAIIQDLRNSTATDNATVSQQHAFEADIGASLLYNTSATLSATAGGGNATGTVNTGTSHTLSNAETAVLQSAVLNANSANAVNLKFADNLQNLTINGTSAATVSLSDNGVNQGVDITVNNGNVILNAGSGSDTVNVTSSANIASGTGKFNLGAGNDSLLWSGNAASGAANSVGSGISANGGEGVDTISANFITKNVAITGSLLRTATITSNASQFSNFEKIDLAGYIGKATVSGGTSTAANHTFDFGVLTGNASTESSTTVTTTNQAATSNIGSQGFVLSGLADAVKVINAAGGNAAQLEITGNATAASDLSIAFRQNATDHFNINFNAESTSDVNAGSLALSSSSSALMGTALATVNIASGGTGDFDNILALTGSNSQVRTLNISGDHALDLNLGSGFSNVRTIDASSNTGGLNLDTSHGGTGDGLIVQLLNALPLGAVTTGLLAPVLTALGLNGYQLKITGTGAADNFDIAANTSVTGGAGANNYELKSSTSSAGVTINDFDSAKDTIVDGLSGLKISNDASGSAVADYGTRSADVLDGILGTLLGGVVNSAAGLLGGILGLGSSNALTSKVGIASVAFDGTHSNSYVIIDNNNNGTLDRNDSVIYLTDQNHQSLLDSLHYAPEVSVNGVADTAVTDLAVA